MDLIWSFFSFVWVADDIRFFLFRGDFTQNEGNRSEGDRAKREELLRVVVVLREAPLYHHSRRQKKRKRHRVQWDELFGGGGRNRGRWGRGAKRWGRA